MDYDDSCVMKYIEIVPRDQFEDCSDVTDVKCEPLSVKVGVVYSFCFTYLVYMHICAAIFLHLLLFLLLLYGFYTRYVIVYCILSNVPQQFHSIFYHFTLLDNIWVLQLLDLFCTVLCFAIFHNDAYC